MQILWGEAGIVLNPRITHRITQILRTGVQPLNLRYLWYGRVSLIW